jgi:YHS domain-containing protein
MKGKEESMATDPICGMEVEEAKAAATTVYQGKTYYFCAVGCKQAFEKAPEKYLGKEEGHHGQ